MLYRTRFAKGPVCCYLILIDCFWSSPGCRDQESYSESGFHTRITMEEKQLECKMVGGKLVVSSNKIRSKNLTTGFYSLGFLEGKKNWKVHRWESRVSG